MADNQTFGSLFLGDAAPDALAALAAKKVSDRIEAICGGWNFAGKLDMTEIHTTIVDVAAPVVAYDEVNVMVANLPPDEEAHFREIGFYVDDCGAALYCNNARVVYLMLKELRSSRQKVNHSKNIADTRLDEANKVIDGLKLSLEEAQRKAKDAEARVTEAETALQGKEDEIATLKDDIEAKAALISQLTTFPPQTGAGKSPDSALEEELRRKNALIERLRRMILNGEKPPTFDPFG